MTHRDYLIKIRREWTNDFLSVERFSEYHGLTPTQGEALIRLAQDVDNSNYPDQ